VTWWYRCELSSLCRIRPKQIISCPVSRGSDCVCSTPFPLITHQYIVIKTFVLFHHGWTRDVFMQAKESSKHYSYQLYGKYCTIASSPVRIGTRTGQHFQATIPAEKASSSRIRAPHRVRCEDAFTAFATHVRHLYGI